MNTVLLLFVLGASISSVACACDNCHRCVNDRCGIYDEYPCYCISGCKVGYFGKGCRQDCPEQCVTCGRDYSLQDHPTYGICYECAEGFHNGSSTNCLCPINCVRCNSTTTCTTCKDGWHGSKCDNQCPSSCMSCESATECFACQKGWYGVACEKRCAQNCNGGVCNKYDGKCNQGCVNGWFGNYCLRQCSRGCRDSICSKDYGTCVYGCHDDFVAGSYNNCTDCVTGRYGDICDKDCPSKTCLNNECDRLSGQCRKCQENFILGSISYCDVCVVGKYGHYCDQDCLSNNCFRNECDRRTGQCFNCITGFYGRFCNNSCADGCLSALCDFANGRCSCKTDYSGDKCCLHSSHCVLCRNTTHCMECEDGYFGSFCNNSCPSNCLDDCLLNSRECISCTRGFFGSRCERLCSERCLDVDGTNVCDDKNGTCLQGCVQGYYKDQCSGECSPSCLRSSCHQDTGVCIGCENGFYGSLCDKPCSRLCVNYTCAQLDGVCLHGYGDEYEAHKNTDSTTKGIAINFIAGWVVAGCFLVVIVVLVAYIYHLRRTVKTTARNATYEKTVENIAYEETAENIIYENTSGHKKTNKETGDVTELTFYESLHCEENTTYSSLDSATV